MDIGPGRLRAPPEVSFAMCTAELATVIPNFQSFSLSFFIVFKKKNPCLPWSDSCIKVKKFVKILYYRPLLTLIFSLIPSPLIAFGFYCPHILNQLEGMNKKKSF